MTENNENEAIDLVAIGGQVMRSTASTRRGLGSRGRLLAGAALACLLAGPVAAQSNPSAPQKDGAQASAGGRAVDEVVVTGTLIRGLAAPTGADLMTVDAQKIQSSGKTDAIDLLNQTVPQLPTFNSVSTGSAGFGTPVTKIGLRGFGNSLGNASGATATLVLFNGHRVVPVGILSTEPDPELIPADALDAVQVMPDGGSATYGSDAVGGVVNFVTRKHLDGVIAHVQESLADHYNETNLSLVAGQSWTGGNLVISLSHVDHNALFGRDRSYITQNFAGHGGSDFRSTACPFGSFTVNGVTYSGATPAPVPAAPLCQQNANTSLVPSEQRNSVFAYVEQQLADNLKFSMDGFFSIRNDHVYIDTAAVPVTVSVNNTNPFFRPVAGETSQTVTYNLSRALGPSFVTPQEFRAWQIDPSLAWQITPDWEARVDLLYGESRAILQDREGINGAVNLATTVDPYDPGQTPAAVRTAIASHQIYTKGTNTLESAQLVVNGKLFTAPGGDVRIAAGAEYRRSTLDNLTYTGLIGDIASAQSFPAKRTIGAEFAELFIPIVGSANAMPGIRQLSIDAAVRHDHYSDFGDTTNPRFGIDYRPIDDLLLRANYQTTFDAPSLADSGNQIDTRLVALTILPHANLLVIAGAGQNVQPETGETFSVGGDWTPSALPGLKVSATYWHTTLDHLVGLSLGQFGLVGALGTSYNLCGVGVIFPPSSAGPCTAAFVNSIQNKWVRTDFGAAPGINTVADLFAPGNLVLGFLDARRGNFGTEKIDGIDFSASYSRDVGIGRAFADVAGTYILNKKISNFDGGPFQDYLSGATVLGATPRYNLVATVGLIHGPYTGRVSVTHNDGYDIPKGTAVGQTSVDSFTLVNLSLSANLGAFMIAKDNTLELSVDNIFDTDPPFYAGQPTPGALSGFANGGTLGRMVRIGLRSRF